MSCAGYFILPLREGYDTGVYGRYTKCTLGILIHVCSVKNIIFSIFNNIVLFSLFFERIALRLVLERVAILLLICWWLLFLILCHWNGFSGLKGLAESILLLLLRCIILILFHRGIIHTK